MLLFPTLKKNLLNFFCRKIILSHFTFYAIFNIKQNKKYNIEKCLFTYWLNGRWFLQIVDGDSWNLYPLYPLFPCSDFVSQMWGGLGGGGGCNFCLTFYAISNISRTKIWEYKPIISHLIFSSCFFCMFFKISSFLHVSCYFQH